MMIWLLLLSSVPLSLMPSLPVQASAADLARYRVLGPATRVEREQVVATGAEIEAFGATGLDVLATPAQAIAIERLGFQVHKRPSSLASGEVDPAYHTYAEMVTAVEQIAVAYPNIVQLFSIGRSYEGRNLLAARISDNPTIDEAEPEALFVGMYHAREPLSGEMILDLLRMLTAGYDPNQPEAAITRLVNEREIILVFMLNPDGREYDIETGFYRYWRKNRQPDPMLEGINGTDPNRNHSYRWGGLGASSNPFSETYRGIAPRSAPEVAAIEDFVISRVISGTQQIRVAISFHTYGALVLWPYGHQGVAECGLPAADMFNIDRAVFRQLGREMARLINYTPLQSCELYQTNGDFSDWAYGTQRIFAFTFEMYPAIDQVGFGDGFYPPGSVIERETQRVRPAVLYLLEQAECPYALVAATPTRCAAVNWKIWIPHLRHEQ
jgi:hypothetical protein